MTTNDKLKVAAVDAFAAKAEVVPNATSDEDVAEYLKGLMLRRDRDVTIVVTRKAGGPLLARAVWPTERNKG